MPVMAEKFAGLDPVWSDLHEEAIRMATIEPVMASFVDSAILNHQRLEEALTYHLAQKLGNGDVGPLQVRQIFEQAFADEPVLGDEVRADLLAICDRDPAVSSFIVPFLFFKGFHALQAYRVSHWLWEKGRKALALHFQGRISELFGVDINPAARIGCGVMIDHATGVVIGETAVVENDVSMLQGVTLGGTGREQGDRHPKVRRGVMIGAGAKILGNIEIGAYSRVGAGSVVLKDVPEHCTVAGVPAKIVSCAHGEQPTRKMNQIIDVLPDDYQI